MSKEKRGLSGFYFRHQNPETKKWENWCFEDLSLEDQNEVMSGKGEDWLKSLARGLADTLNKIGDQLDLGVRQEEEDEDD